MLEVVDEDDYHSDADPHGEDDHSDSDPRGEDDYHSDSDSAEDDSGGWHQSGLRETHGAASFPCRDDLFYGDSSPSDQASDDDVYCGSGYGSDKRTAPRFCTGALDSDVSEINLISVIQPRNTAKKTAAGGTVSQPPW